METNEYPAAPTSKTSAPGAVSSLVCGIISVVVCWVPIAGLVLGIIGILHHSKAKKNIQANPQSFEGGGMAIGGLVCGIVGTVSSVFYNIFWVIAMMSINEAIDAFDNYGGY